MGDFGEDFNKEMFEENSDDLEDIITINRAKYMRNLDMWDNELGAEEEKESPLSYSKYSVYDIHLRQLNHLLLSREEEYTLITLIKTSFNEIKELCLFGLYNYLRDEIEELKTAINESEDPKYIYKYVDDYEEKYAELFINGWRAEYEEKQKNKKHTKIERKATMAAYKANLKPKEVEITKECFYKSTAEFYRVKGLYDLRERLKDIVDKSHWGEETEDYYRNIVISKMEGMHLEYGFYKRVLNKFISDAKNVINSLAGKNDEQISSLRGMIARADRTIKENEKATEKIFLSNQRLVAKCASGYKDTELSFFELMQEGNTGLRKAIKKFEPERGYKFSTYATPWIKQTIIKAIKEKGRTIKMPLHLSEIIYKINKVNVNYQARFGRDATLEETAQIIKISIPEYKKEENEIKKYKINQIKKAKKYITSFVSLDAPPGNGEIDNKNLYNLEEDKTSPDPYYETARNFAEKHIRELLATLTPRDEIVIRMRFGIDLKREYTLEEVGQEFQVTKEWIRLIEEKALRKLKLRALKRGLISLIY